MSHGNKNPPPPSAAPAIQAVNTPTLSEKLRTETLAKWDAFNNSKNKDILQAPGMENVDSIYENADAMANERQLGGNPGMALSGGGSGNYQAQLAELGKTQRFRNRAAGISNAYGAARAEALGGGDIAANMQMARQGAYADDMLKQQEAYYNRPKPKPLWERIAGLAIGGLGALGTAGGSAGARGLFGVG